MNIGPFPQWSDKKKIVAMDPQGHLSPFLFKGLMERENGMSSLRTSQMEVTEADWSRRGHSAHHSHHQGSHDGGDGALDLSR